MGLKPRRSKRLYMVGFLAVDRVINHLKNPVAERCPQVIEASTLINVYGIPSGIPCK